MRRYSVTLLPAMAVLTLANSGAQAWPEPEAGGRTVDYKAYGGGFCQPQRPHADYAWGGIFNTSSDRVLRVECPIVTADEWAYKARVTVMDRNANDDVTCILTERYVTEWAGRNLWGRTVTRSSSGMDDAFQVLRYDGRLHHPLNVEKLPWREGRGYRYIRCDIPPRHEGRNSGVVAYSVGEIHE